MNIFVLDQNPCRAARFHCDKHVIKMILESAQLLSTAVAAASIGLKVYQYSSNIAQAELRNDTVDALLALGKIVKPTHVNHPCAIWARSSKANFMWLREMAVALCDEKIWRWPENPPHKYEMLLNRIHKIDLVNNLPDTGLTPFALVCGDVSEGHPKFGKPDLAVRLYREYYKTKPFARDYKNDSIPDFMKG